MKFQWTWLLALLFAVIIAIFSVANVEAVRINYVFGIAEWPLVLIILSSALLGAAISGIVAMFRTVMAKRQVKELTKELEAKEATIAAQQNELAVLRREKLQKTATSNRSIENEGTSVVADDKEK